MNQYVKDVAKACGIEKNITFHCLRHYSNSYRLAVNELPKFAV